MKRKKTPSAAQAQISSILERNARVEADKAWELSWSRRCLIALATYAVSLVFLLMSGSPNPYLVAAVPPAAYLLSTLTLPFVKEWWLKSAYKR